MKQEKVLILNVKKRHFNDVKAGVKPFEYRLCKDYWTKRLQKKYTHVEIRMGYPKNDEEDKKIRFPWNGYELQTITHEEFGKEPVEIFAIVLNKSKISNPKSEIRNLLESFLEHPAETKQEQAEMIKVAVEEITALFNQKSNTVGAIPCGCPTPVSTTELWDYFEVNHGLVLLESEIQDIIQEVSKINPHSAFRNPQLEPCPSCENLKQQTESLVREQAKECGKYYNAGYKKGERDRDTIYSAAFGRAGLKQKVAGRIAGHVKKICLEVEQKGSFTQKQCDYRPTYER